MDLVEVDHVDTEAPEAVLDFPANRIALEHVRDLTGLIPDHRALGEDERAAGEARDRLPDDLFRVTEAIDRGGVDPVDAAGNRVADRRNGLRIVLGAPGELPARASQRIRADADRGDLEGAVAESLGLHLSWPA